MEGGNIHGKNVPLYQARIGGSTGRSSSRGFGDPWIGRWDSISGRGAGTTDEEEWGAQEGRSTSYLRALMLACREVMVGFPLRVFLFEGAASKRN